MTSWHSGPSQRAARKVARYGSASGARGRCAACHCAPGAADALNHVCPAAAEAFAGCPMQAGERSGVPGRGSPHAAHRSARLWGVIKSATQHKCSSAALILLRRFPVMPGQPLAPPDGGHLRSSCGPCHYQCGGPPGADRGRPGCRVGGGSPVFVDDQSVPKNSNTTNSTWRLTTFPPCSTGFQPGRDGLSSSAPQRTPTRAGKQRPPGYSAVSRSARLPAVWACASCSYTRSSSGMRKELQ
jgi:hypothetical protein